MPTTGTISPTPGIEPSSETANPVPETAAVRLDDVSFGYGTAPVIREISLAVPSGAFLTLLGPSGCGKTTILKLIGGYLAPDSGRIHLGGRDVTGLPPERRRVGMVFQHFALFPHLTARRNVAFGLEVRGMAAAERGRQVNAIFDRVGLGLPERDRKPAALSGGQQQRVALARALVIHPDLLLLDEPLANLDRHLREQLRDEIRRLQRQTAVTTILVTHDQEEALAVSDLVGVMAGGRILQIGSPTELYQRPRCPFVARFLGDANLLDGSLVGGRPGQVCLVRPERCLLGPELHGCRWQWPAVVVSASFLGADTLAEVACAGGPSLLVRSRDGECRPGRRLTVGFPADAVWPIPDADPEGFA